MHRIFALIITLFITGCNSQQSDLSAVRVKSPEAIEVETFTHQRLTFMASKEMMLIKNGEKKPLLMVFFTTWCPSCVAEIPELVALNKTDGKNVTIMGVLLEPDYEEEKISHFVTQHGITYPLITPQGSFELGKRVGGIRSIPQMFLYDSEGKLFRHYPGPVSRDILSFDLHSLDKGH